MRILIFTTAFFLAFTLSAQRGKAVDSANTKFPRGIYLAFGYTFSGIDIYDNYFANPHRIGFNGRMCYEFSNTMRLCGEVTRIPRFNYAPSWQQLGAYNFDLNIQFMARIKDEYSIFYSFLGICKHQWSGLFVQQSTFYDAVANYQPNTIIGKSWIGMNAGVGLERAFKYFELFAEYRYRFTEHDNVFSVADVSINLGIKKKIPLKKIFRKLGDRYSWF